MTPPFPCPVSGQRRFAHSLGGTGSGVMSRPTQPPGPAPHARCVSFCHQALRRPACTSGLAPGVRSAARLARGPGSRQPLLLFGVHVPYLAPTSR